MMTRYAKVSFWVVLFGLVTLPCYVSAASITEQHAAIGEGCVASGDYSTAMGKGTTASDYASTAMGSSTTASGASSTATGNLTTASGIGSTAMGKETTASQYASTAMGFKTTSSGSASTSMGEATTASGWASTSIGFRTAAGGSLSFAGGGYMQLSDTANYTFVWGNSDTATPIDTPNAFLIFPVGTAGKVGIGTPAPETKLDIRGEADATVLSRINQTGNRNWCGLRLDRNTSEKWFIGMPKDNDYLLFRRTASSDDIVIDLNGRVGIGRTPTPDGFNRFEVEGSAAKTAGGSTWATLSDGRLKDIKADYHKGLPEIMSLQPVVFSYKKNNPRNFPSDQRNVGFVAQEVEHQFPGAVHIGRDGYMELNLHEINVAVVNAVKELKAENDKLKADNEILKKKIEKIEALLGI